MIVMGQKDVGESVTIEVGNRHPHTRLVHSGTTHRTSRFRGDLFVSQRGIRLFGKEKIGCHVIGDIDFGNKIQVKVGSSGSEPLTSLGIQAPTVGDLGKRPIPKIAIDTIFLSFKAPWSAIPPRGAVVANTMLRERNIDVIHDEQVE